MTIIIYDDIYLEHGSEDHVESPMRLVKTVEYLQKQGLWEKIEEPRAATLDEIQLIHEKPMIERARALCEAGGGFLDPDTQVSPRSFEAALYAAGGVLTAIDKVMNGADRSALCLVRPPGHHATATRPMGFCIFNNIAVGARYLQKKHGIERIAIIDWDVHHGNGTQEAFFGDPGVLYFSTHRSPFYPGSGREAETGEGAGKGSTINRTGDYGMTNERFLEIFCGVVENEVASFRPEFVLISAGFDALAGDPIGHYCLEPEDFGKMTEAVCKVAGESAQGRIVSTLEGGYDLELLPRSVYAHLKALRDYC